jgi:hypothetical protein
MEDRAMNLKEARQDAQAWANRSGEPVAVVRIDSEFCAYSGDVGALRLGVAHVETMDPENGG